MYLQCFKRLTIINILIRNKTDVLIKTQFFFPCVFDQIISALVIIRNFFQKQILTNPNLLNGSALNSPLAVWFVWSVGMHPLKNLYKKCYCIWNRISFAFSVCVSLGYSFHGGPDRYGLNEMEMVEDYWIHSNSYTRPLNPRVHLIRLRKSNVHCFVGEGFGDKPGVRYQFRGGWVLRWE